MKTYLYVFFLIAISFQPRGQSQSSSFDAEYFLKQRFAHRGGYANGPENTLKTILNNIHNGVNAVEIDIAFTADHQLILFHDDTINRILESEKKVFVNELNLSEIQSIPLRDKSQGVQYICTLEELIDTLTIIIPKEKLQFILELDFKPNGKKRKMAIAELTRILEKEKAQFGDGLYDYFFVSTFYPNVLADLRKSDSLMNLAFAVNSNPPKKKFFAKLAVLFSPRIIKKNKARIIDVDLCQINDRYIKKWDKRGILINAYTANTACQKTYLEQFKVAYTTNCPGEYCFNDESDLISKTKWCKYCD